MSWSTYFMSGEGQTCVMGSVFLFVFMAYYMIQDYSSNLYGPTLGSNMELTLYAVFTLFCFIAPSVTNKLGSRFTMFLGVLGYACLVLFSLAYLLDLAGSWIVILGGAINGIGAALIWTAQGRLMLQYSDGTDSGRIFAIFWSIFNLSAVLGGIMLFVYFSNTSSEGEWPLYVVFMVLMVLGGLGTLLLLPPEKVTHGKKTELLIPADGVDPDGNKEEEEELSHESWVQEMVETIALFKTEDMARLSIIFWYTGFNQPYQLVTFGDRFFTESTLGLVLALFYVFELIGAYFSAKVVDGRPPRQAARYGYTVFFIVTTVGFAFALWMESEVVHHAAEVSHRGTVWNVLRGSIAMAMWGFSDAQIQALAYWQLGKMYIKGNDQARAVGFFKMVQSAGWCIGFALAPANRLSPILQLFATAACYVIGLAVIKYPEHNPAVSLGPPSGPS